MSKSTKLTLTNEETLVFSPPDNTTHWRIEVHRNTQMWTGVGRSLADALEDLDRQIGKRV